MIHVLQPTTYEDRDRCGRLLRELEQKRPARSDIIQLPLKLPLAVLRSRRDTVLHGVQDDLLQVVIDEGCLEFSTSGGFGNCRFLTSDLCLAFRGDEKGRFKVSSALLQAKITVEFGLLYWPFLPTKIRPERR